MSGPMELAALFRPEIALALAALGALGFGVANRDRRLRDLVATGIGLGGCGAASGLALGAGELGPVAAFFRALLPLLTACALMLIRGSAPARHRPEQIALMLIATIGMMVLAGARDLLVVFLGLETAGLPLVALTALGAPGKRPAEAALKFFLMGALASAVILFGMSLVYGMTGSLAFDALAPTRFRDPQPPLLLAGLGLVLVGFGFKVAAVPFHLWAPDAYAGAPAPAAAQIASGSKVAGFVILTRFWIEAAHPGSAADGAGILLVAVATASMLLGNLAAIAQQSVRRLLGYSAIAQGGYMVAALGAGGAPAAGPVLFYAVVYAVSVLGAFGVVARVETETGSDRIAAFAGLARRAPGSALAMLVFLTTLAGLPPLPGFLGKLLLFKSMLGPAGVASSPSLWLVALAVTLSAVSLYYYLIVLKSIFVSGDPPQVPSAGPPDLLAAGVVFLLAIVTVGLALAPGPLLEALLRATGG